MNEQNEISQTPSAWVDIYAEMPEKTDTVIIEMCDYIISLETYLQFTKFNKTHIIFRNIIPLVTVGLWKKWRPFPSQI